jgi:hypothetical protein
MDFTTLEIPGVDAVRILNEHRSRYASTGQYPFLIGDAEDLSQLEEIAEDDGVDPAEIIRGSSALEIADWIAEIQQNTVESEFTPDEVLGEWPPEITHKGSISLHRDVLTRSIKPRVYVGLAKIEKPWHLPAVVKFGGSNESPEPEVHCAFHRVWQEKYGAEITGMSGAVIECAVRNPPTDRANALALAWEQYWYCCDIVEQGCGTISILAATLLNSPYWYFWWD